LDVNILSENDATNVPNASDESDRFLKNSIHKKTYQNVWLSAMNWPSAFAAEAN